MSLSIFVSHSFDHPDKLLGVLRFIRDRGIDHTDHSVPAWEPYDGPDVQAEIQGRIQRCDRVIVVLTKGIQDSPWITAEVEWARRYRKPVIAVWPNGDAGSLVPEFVANSDPYLSGWRATSVEKALNLEGLDSCRAIDLAEDADRDGMLTGIVQAAGVASLILVGVDLLNLTQMRDQLRARGFTVIFDPDQAPIVPKVLAGAAAGAFLGYAIGDIFGSAKHTPHDLAIAGALLGGGVALHQHLKGEIRKLGPLVQMDLKPLMPGR